MRDATRIKLCSRKCFQSVLCQECRHSSSAKKWKCQCRKLWYTCHLRSTPGFACPMPMQPTSRPIHTGTRKIPVLSMPSDHDFSYTAELSASRPHKRAMEVQPSESTSKADNANKRYRTGNGASGCRAKVSKRRATTNLEDLEAYARIKEARNQPIAPFSMGH